MNATNYTPGPWERVDISTSRVTKRERLCGCDVWMELEYDRSDEGEANARLIAAAPDLLEACRQIVWKLSHNYSPSGKGDDCRPGTIDRRDATVHMAEAAIAKAMGL